MQDLRTIFYVDDDPDDLDFFQEAVDAIGRDVTLFHLGDHMLHALNNPPPNPSVIFVDLNMPGKNGYDIIREIKASNVFKNLPIIILSTASDSKSIELSKAAGANLYIKKANSVGELRKSIEYVLGIDWKGGQPSCAFVYSPQK
ncbi:MAG TPA: response regulator [Flavobacterium sp.]|jgi:CheY-like chemotaxis protein